MTGTPNTFTYVHYTKLKIKCIIYVFKAQSMKKGLCVDQNDWWCIRFRIKDLQIFGMSITHTRLNVCRNGTINRCNFRFRKNSGRLPKSIYNKIHYRCNPLSSFNYTITNTYIYEKKKNVITY